MLIAKELSELRREQLAKIVDSAYLDLLAATTATANYTGKLIRQNLCSNVAAVEEQITLVSRRSLTYYKKFLTSNCPTKTNQEILSMLNYSQEQLEKEGIYITLTDAQAAVISFFDQDEE
jgi:hypothetical protein